MTVFVSYSSRDRDAVKSLTQDLQDADEVVWMDQRLAGGDTWWRAILEQIRSCDVFIFALSQNSIESKPCQAELKYVQALGLPILPVQVGPVDSMQLNPLATVQAIDYRHPTPSTAMQLIAALHRTRAQCQPLPSPLPDEPPVPFEYLIRLYSTIAGPDQLSPRDQAALVAQLQVGLREDGQHEAARKDIVILLNKLHEREDVTYRTRTEIEAILASTDVESHPPPPIDTETVAHAEPPGAITPSVSTGTPTDTENKPADTDRTTLDRPTNADLRTEPDDHRLIAIAPSDELTSTATPGKSSDRPVASATKTTPAPSAKPPLFQRLSRRTTIALIAGGVSLVAIVAIVLVTVLPTGSPSRTDPSDAVMLSVETDPAKINGVNAFLRPLIIPPTVRTHGTPGARGCDDFHAWAVDNQGVDAGETVVQIVAQGTTDNAVLIQNMRVSVIDTSPPLTGIAVSCMPQGVAQRRGIAVDLDAKPPAVNYKSDSNAPFGFTLGKGETEWFLVSATAAKATYRWKISIDVVVNGAAKSLEVGGKDGFITTAPPAQDSEWMWNFSDLHWMHGGGQTEQLPAPK